MVIKEIKIGLNEWRDIPYSWIGRLKTLEMLISPQMLCNTFL